MYDADDFLDVFVIMDPCEGSSSMKNPMRLERDSEKSKSNKATSQNRGPNDDGENVFTSMSNQTDSSLALQNRPQARHMNSLSSNESGQSNRLSENTPEYYRNSGSQSQSYKLSSSSTDQVESTSSSKSESSAYDNGLDSNEAPICQRHKVYLDKSVNSFPSTSGTSKSGEALESNFKESRKRPSTLKLNRPNLDDDSSSDTGNDDYSLGSEDGCIYTYRGGEHLADLPSSFFSLDMGLPLDKHLPLPPNYPVPQQAAPNARDRDSRASSPDMEFLEMDFDPGPSCEVDTGDESTPDADLDAASNMPEESEPVIRGTSPEYSAGAVINPPVVPVIPDSELYRDVPSTSRGISYAQGDVAEEPKTQTSHIYYGPYITHVNARGEQILVRRTMSHWPYNTPVSLHVSSGDLVSPREMLNCKFLFIYLFYCE